MSSVRGHSRCPTCQNIAEDDRLEEFHVHTKLWIGRSKNKGYCSLQAIKQLTCLWEMLVSKSKGTVTYVKLKV